MCRVAACCEGTFIVHCCSPQVIVGCEGSTVTVWDIDSGNKVLHFPCCHGNAEITCLQLDSSGRRLITGSRYGGVKVWNYHTGECLKTLHHNHKTEVTGVVSIADKGLLFTVGWSKQITAFPDEEDVSQQQHSCTHPSGCSVGH